MSNQIGDYNADPSFTEPPPPSSGHRAGYARTSSGADSLLLQSSDDERKELLRRTLESLSSDQQRELMSEYKACAREMAMTRALPFAGVVVGSLYWAKRYLPPTMQLFGNRWPFYVATGLSALMVGQLLSFDKCNERAREFLYRISAQGTDGSVTTNQMESEPREVSGRELTYDDLREQNREEYRKQRSAARLPRAADPSPRQLSSPPPFNNQPVPMSGTSGKASSYGDEGFS